MEKRLISKDNIQRVVVCASNRSKSGKIICGARHWDAAMRSTVIIDGKMPSEWHGADQGFIDQFCVWMDRQEAWKVAEAAGQIKYGRDYSKGTLYSEDLY
jgi:hypothetical protein